MFGPESARIIAITMEGKLAAKCPDGKSTDRPFEEFYRNKSPDRRRNGIRRLNWEDFDRGTASRPQGDHSNAVVALPKRAGKK